MKPPICLSTKDINLRFASELIDDFARMMVNNKAGMHEIVEVLNSGLRNEAGGTNRDVEAQGENQVALRSLIDCILITSEANGRKLSGEDINEVLEQKIKQYTPSCFEFVKGSLTKPLIVGISSLATNLSRIITSDKGGIDGTAYNSNSTSMQEFATQVLGVLENPNSDHWRSLASSSVLVGLGLRDIKNTENCTQLIGGMVQIIAGLVTASYDRSDPAVDNNPLFIANMVTAIVVGAAISVHPSGVAEIARNTFNASVEACRRLVPNSNISHENGVQLATNQNVRNQSTMQ